MFSLSRKHDSFSKSRSNKTTKSGSFREHAVSKRRYDPQRSTRRIYSSDGPSSQRSLTSPIVTISVGQDRRLFAAHEEILLVSPYFASNLHMQQSASRASERCVVLPEEEPEIFSCVLEYLYKGDYHPRLVHNTSKNAWELSAANKTDHNFSNESTTYISGIEGELLRDTVIYCTAERYGLDELKKIALRKQGLQSGIQCSTILRSARYAYSNTPDSDSKLRAHYLALIIRSRATFKRSGTMQMEFFSGGSQLFFDLFVAIANHLDDVSAVNSPSSLRHR